MGAEEAEWEGPWPAFYTEEREEEIDAVVTIDISGQVRSTAPLSTGPGHVIARRQIFTGSQ